MGRKPSFTVTKTATITNTMVALAVFVLGASSLAAAAALMNVQSSGGSIQLAGEIPCTTTSTPPGTGGGGSTSTTTPKITSTGSLTIASVSDSTTVSNIKVPETNQVLKQLGKWSLTAKDESINVKHIRLALVDKTYKLKKNATEFASLTLVVEESFASGMSVNAVLNNGYVDVDINNLVVNPANPVTIILKGIINDSGIMSPGAIEAFAISNSTSTGWVAVGASSGDTLTSDKITASPSIFGWNGLSTFYLYHNSALSVNPIKGTDNSLIKPSSDSLIMPIKMSVVGESDILLKKIIVTVDTSGLATSTSSSAGMITNFRLVTTDSTGAPAAILGKVDTCITGGDKSIHGKVKVGTKSCYVNSATLIFDDKTSASGMKGLVIPQKQVGYFNLMADTTSALNGNKTGAVTIKGSISGKKGWQQHPTDPKRSEWGQGSIEYYYSVVGSIGYTAAFTASDSYPIQTPTYIMYK